MLAMHIPKKGLILVIQKKIYYRAVIRGNPIAKISNDKFVTTEAILMGSRHVESAHLLMS